MNAVVPERWRQWGLRGLLLVVACTLAAPVNAYIGPGLSPATIVVVPLVAIGFLLLLFLLVFIPARRAWRKRRAAREGSSGGSGQA